MAPPARPLTPYETFEHTADAGIIARGADLKALFANAALGLFALMVDLRGVRRRQEITVAARARDTEGLLVNWLSELLYQVDANGLLFSRFDIDELTETTVRARAFGEPIDRERHRLHFGVKAVTRHLLEIAREPNGGYRARVLFDI